MAMAWARLAVSEAFTLPAADDLKSSEPIPATAWSPAGPRPTVNEKESAACNPAADDAANLFDDDKLINCALLRVKSDQARHEIGLL